MRRSLAQFTTCVVGLAVMTSITGCYSMNGYMMNSSGQAYYERGNYAMAAAEFEKAVASAPSNPDYTANLARTRYKMGDVGGAEQIYRRNLTMSPSHQPSYHGLAELMVAQGRGDEATAMLSTWSSTQPYAAESHLELAWLQNQMGQPEAANQSLQQAMRVNPGHPKVLAHMGQQYQEQGQVDQAIAMYQRSLQADWHQPHVHTKLSNAVAAAGPNHPINARAMSRGVRTAGFTQPPGYGTQQAFGPQGFGPQMAGQPHPPMQMAHRMPPGGPWAPGLMQASHATPPMPVGFGFPMGAPASAAVPTPTAAPTTAAAPAESEPTPDPAFGQAVPTENGVPAMSVSHQTLMVPDNAEQDIPEVEAF